MFYAQWLLEVKISPSAAKVHFSEQPAPGFKGEISLYLSIATFLRQFLAGGSVLGLRP